jgi:hypothetical protein
VTVIVTGGKVGIVSNVGVGRSVSAAKVAVDATAASVAVGAGDSDAVVGGWVSAVAIAPSTVGSTTAGGVSAPPLKLQARANTAAANIKIHHRK